MTQDVCLKLSTHRIFSSVQSPPGAEAATEWGGVVQKKEITFLLRGSLVFVAQVCCARARVSACYFYVHSGLIIGMARILVLD